MTTKGLLLCPNCPSDPRSPHGVHGNQPCPHAGCPCRTSTMTNPQYQQYKTALIPTGADIEGPFYKADAPFVYDHLIPVPALVISGTVQNVHGAHLHGIVLDFWQASEQGEYDMQGHNLRGKVITDQGGRYGVGTIKPGFYKISDPGQPDEFRCSHIHVKLWLDGVLRLTTQLYFANDPHDDTDHWFDPKRCLTFPDPANLTQATFDFVLKL